MIVELDSVDLIRLIKSVDIGYSLDDHPKIKPYGYVMGGFDNSWVWYEKELKKLPEAELFEIYLICKNIK